MGESRTPDDAGESDASGEGESEETAGSPAEEPTTDEQVGGRPCPLCDRPMYSRHCKYVCPEHGVVFDCADTFY